MYLSTSVDSGIGLIAGKLMCGKAIPKSDSTYLTTVKLREKFILLKRFLSIKEQPIIETKKIESLKNAIIKLQEDLTVQKTITYSVSEKNLKLVKQSWKTLDLNSATLHILYSSITTNVCSITD
jgi:hypothetical protein